VIVLDLAFDEEQELLRRTVRDLLAVHCPTAVVRACEDDPIGFPPTLWQQLAELDLVGLLLPETAGGSGRGLLDGVVLYEELGRALAPVPHFVSAVMAGGVLAEAGSAAQRAQWLVPVAAGTTIMTTAWLEPDRGFGPAGVATVAEASGGGWRLTGVKRHVAFARAAAAMVVVARTDAGAIGLFLVPTDAPGVRLTQQRTIDSATQYRVELGGVHVAHDQCIGPPAEGWELWQTVLRRGLVLLAAQAVGGARRTLELTVQYAKDRHQFGKPIGAFQAISHYLADAVTVVDGAEQLVHEAAWAADRGRPEAGRLAAMAKLFACRTYRDVTATAQQVHGGVGFTVDLDVQLYFRRAKALQLDWLDSATLEQEVASCVLAAAPAGSQPAVDREVVGTVATAGG
jgi:alkylation response protein AidB-like acyl-CoA dehydrogenase